MLPVRAQGKGPKEYLNTSLKSTLHFCIIIINLAKRFLFATNRISFSLHFYVTHSLNLENVSILIFLKGSKKSLDFSIHRSSINVSIRSVPSLKKLNV